MPADTPDVDRLPCGAAVEDLLAQVADPAAPRDPAHQRTCGHCKATLAQLTALWTPVDDLARQDVRAPAQLLATVMGRVRELPRRTWHAVLPSDPAAGGAQTRIAARVVAVLARVAAQSVPQVALALGSGRRGDRSGTDVAVAGEQVVIDVQLVVDHGAYLPEVARQVRREITRHIAARTGLRPAEVNVTIADIRTGHP